MAPVERAVAVRMSALVADYVRSMGQAEKATAAVGTAADTTSKKAGRSFADMAKWADENEQHLNTLTAGLGLVGAGLTAMAAISVKKFADFDQAMSNVIATGDEARENQEALRDAAVDAGARTVFSATEAAGAIENLLKAGVSAKDVLAGGLNGALDLAAAGGMDVAQAAEIAASALTQFNQDGSRTAHVADLLAAGAGKAQGEVADLGMALNQSGLVANQMGLSIEETVGTLTAFAKAGLLGSDAGTSFRAMLLRLANPTGESARLMDELGLRAYDAQGGFVGMESLAGQLQDRLGGLTEEQRNATLATIFGQDAIRSASILYAQGADGIREWTQAVDDSGYASDVAATRLDNLKGDLEALSGSLDTVLIQSGSGANDILRGLVQSAEAVVDALGQIPEPVLSAMTVLVGTAGLATLGVAGMVKLGTSIASAKVAMDTLKISASTAKIAVAGVGLAIGVATIALSAWASAAAAAQARTDAYADTLDDLGNQTDATIRNINDVLSEQRNDWLGSIFGRDPRSLIEQGKELGLTVADLRNYILGEQDAVERVTAARERYLDGVTGTSAEYGNAESYVRRFVGALDAEAKGLSTAEKQTTLKALADQEAGVASEDAAAATDEQRSAIDRLAAAHVYGTDITKDYADALEELIDTQHEAAGIALGLRDAQRQYEEAIDGVDAALKENGQTTDISTEKGRANQAALDAIAESGWDVVDSMRENGASQEELQATVRRTRDDFVSLAKKLGLSADDAEALADKLGLIPQNVSVSVAVDTSAAALKLANLKSQLNDTLAATRNPNVGWGYGQGRAAGGAISGPGSGTSDSIPAMLSNGEHVLTADDVHDMGGQGAVYRMRAMAQAGRLRFAAGGSVSQELATAGIRVPSSQLNASAVMSLAVPSSQVASPGRAPVVSDLRMPDSVRLDAQSVREIAAAVLAGSRNVSVAVLEDADSRSMYAGGF